MQITPIPPRRPAALSPTPYRRAVLVAALVLLALALAPRADAAVYWTNALGPTIGHANDDGSGVNQAFIPAASQPAAVVVDGAHVYWSDFVDHTIGRANLDGTGVNQRFITGVQTSALAVDGAHIYWGNVFGLGPQGAPDDAIGRANLDGSGVNPTFISGASNPEGVAVDGAHLYWSNEDTHSIGRANLDGSGVNQSFVAVGVNRSPVGVAVDGAHIYWANFFQDTIGRANLDGSGVNSSFVRGAGLPQGVAVDAGHVYWTNNGAIDQPQGSSIGRANLDGTGVDALFITGAAVPQGVAVTGGAPASTAGSAREINGALQFVATAPTVANNVTLTGPANGFYTVRDTAAPITPGLGCQAVSANEVRCASGAVTRSQLDTGAGNDTVTVSTTMRTTISGGTGNDRLTGGDGNDFLTGDDGNDTLAGGNGDDALIGGAGNDTLKGGAGSDFLLGLDGVDTASYADHAAVVVSINDESDDGNASDGPAGLRDDVDTSVENLIGGSGADTLTGSELTNRITGGAGADRLSGLGGADTLLGGGGPDALIGGDGVDTASYADRASVAVDIDNVADDGNSADGPVGARDNVDTTVENLIGGTGDDTLIGSALANRITGGLGVDRLHGLGGDDTLVAKDGVVDTEIQCDGGVPAGAADQAIVDASDPAASNCETIIR